MTTCFAVMYKQELLEVQLASEPVDQYHSSDGREHHLSGEDFKKKTNTGGEENLQTEFPGVVVSAVFLPIESPFSRWCHPAAIAETELWTTVQPTSEYHLRHAGEQHKNRGPHPPT